MTAFDLAHSYSHILVPTKAPALNPTVNTKDLTKLDGGTFPEIETPSKGVGVGVDLRVGSVFIDFDVLSRSNVFLLNLLKSP